QSPGRGAMDQPAHEGQGRLWRRLVQRRLLLRVTVPAVLAVALFAVALLDIRRAQVPWPVLLWLVPGLASGYPFGRATKVAWDSDASQLVAVGSGLGLFVAMLAVRVTESVVVGPLVLNLPYASHAAALFGVGLLLGRALG